MILKGVQMAKRAARSGNASSRAAKPALCRACGRLVLRGLDGDRCALLVECDPHEIDTTGELLALMLNLRTYTLTRSPITSAATGWALDPRYPTAIRRGQRTALVAQHRCGIAIPPTTHKRIDLFDQPPALPEHAPF